MGRHRLAGNTGARAASAVTALALIAGGLVVGPFAGVASAAPMIFVVTEPGNAADQVIDGNCNAIGTPVCTLRAAIQEANANPGPDTINFNLAGPSFRITLTDIGAEDGLPTITSPVTINGASQVGGVPQVSGNYPTANVWRAFVVGAGGDGSTIRGLEIVRTASAGITLQSDGNTVVGNFIGTTSTSAVSCQAQPCSTTTGVDIQGGSANVIGGTTAADRNVIANNTNYGVHITSGVGAADGNVVQGNYIGTNVAGSAPLGNGYGIFIDGIPEPTNTTIGGTSAGAGNLLSGNTFYGLYTPSGNVTVTGNIVGLDASGTAAVGNGNDGIYAPAAHDIAIGGATAAARNVISGNGGSGVHLYNDTGTSPDVTVMGNYIGTDITGMVDRGNAGHGLVVTYVNGFAASDNVISGNQGVNVQLNGSAGSGLGLDFLVSDNIVGLVQDGSSLLSSPDPSPKGNGSQGIAANDTLGLELDGNVVSANGGEGIALDTATDATLTNNTVGTNAAGTAALGNANSGIYGSGVADSAIGASGSGNLVSGNEPSYGMFFSEVETTKIQGNLIGTDATGNAALGNQGYGMYIQFGEDDEVGGSAVGEGNVIAANISDGIYLYGTDDSTVLGNKVGVGADGVTALPNGANGIVVDVDSDRNTVGGTTAGAANILAHNTTSGIVISSNSDGNVLRGNSIDSNGLLGIDLGNDTVVTPNDPGDLDTGSNRLQNFPFLTSAASNASGTQVQGTLDSRANRVFDLDFYASPACDGSGHGEGAVYLGSVPVTTDGSGSATFVANLSTIAPFGNAVTATATDRVRGDTSEFSSCATTTVIPTVSIAPTSPTVNEGAGTANFTVTLSQAPTLTPVTVRWQTADGTATGGSDYTAQAPTTLTYGVGQTVKNINVPITNDLLDEVDETFTVFLSDPDNTLIAAGGGTSTVTIADNDAPPTVSVADAPTVTETGGGSTQTFTVSLSAPSSKPVTVYAATNAGTATAGADYTSTATLVTFVPGVVSQLVNVTVNDDLIDEPQESYTLDLTEATNATIGDGVGVGAIDDNDVWPTVSVTADSATVAESGSAAFTVTLSQASAQTVTVTWQTADGTASSADYTPQAPTVLTFTPGQTSKPITVPVTSDVIDEANETFSVTLSSPTNAFLAGSSAGVTINDNDATPSLSVGDPTNVTEIPGGVNQTFQVTLSAASGLPVTVVASTVPGTASSGSDYTSTATLLTFPAGTTTQNLVVNVLDDSSDEPDETYDVKLSSATNATIGDGTGTGTIVDDDIWPTISVSPAGPSVAESGTANFNVVLSQSSNLPVAVTWQTANGTATGGADFATQAPTVVNFAPGETSKPITVAITGDTLDEFDETFSISLSSPVNGYLGAGSAVTILDNDATPTVSVVGPSPVAEATGATATFQVNLSAASGRTVTVLAATEAGTAVPGVDYTSKGSLVTFNPGETSKAFVVTVLNDPTDEPDQTFSTLLDSPTNATLGTATAAATIVDEDAAPTITIDNATLVEGDSGTQLMEFIVRLSARSEQAVSVRATTVNSGATAPTDFNARTNIQVNWPIGIRNVLFKVTIKGDASIEPDETFLVNLSAAVNATISDSQAIGTITNDD